MHDTITRKVATQLEFHLINLPHNTKHGLGPTFSQSRTDKNGLINIILTQKSEKNNLKSISVSIKFS